MPWTWNRILIRSSGATAERDAPPATPPAIKVAAHFVCGAAITSSSSPSCSCSSLPEMSGSKTGAVKRRRSGAPAALDICATLALAA